MGMHGVGHRRRQVQLTDLLSHISRDEFNGRLHFRHHPLGLINPVQACLTETFMQSNSANGANLCADICRNEPAVAPHAALQIDKVVGLADATDALGDLLSLCAEALVLEARRLRFLFELFQAYGCFGGRPGPRL